MRKSPIWRQVAMMPVLDVVNVPHEHRVHNGNKCILHQTLSANASRYGYRLHVFHDGDELYVVRLPLTVDGGQR